jgi:threonine dehydratase
VTSLIPSPSPRAGIIPKKPPGGSTLMTERTGCVTFPAENSASAFSIAGIKSRMRRCCRTCCSVIKTGAGEFIQLYSRDSSQRTAVVGGCKNDDFHGVQMMQFETETQINFESVRAAHNRIRPYIHRTPVLTSSRLNDASGSSLFFKCENFQKVGAFKARGATNAVLALDDDTARRGVATHSSGNHAQALARAAKIRGIPAYIVMPSNSAKVKIAAVEGYGGRIEFCEPNQKAREQVCARVIAESGATLIHSFENLDVMAGQGTAAVELLEDISDLDVILCPVGGGGLLSGTAVAANSLRPTIQIIAAEPANADDAARSFRAGHLIQVDKPNTIADGLRTNVGAPNFAVMQKYVDDVVTVTEESIVLAMRAIWQTMKIVIEPSAAVPYAAIMEEKVPVAGRRVGVILSGGNVDLDALPWLR